MAKRNIATKPVSTKAGSKLATIKPVATPATSKPATVAAKPDKPATVAKPGIPLIERQSHRDAAYLAGASYPFGRVSATDEAYLRLFAGFCKADKLGVANVSAITVSGAKPAGVLVSNNRARLHRLVQAGYCEYAGADKLTFRIAKPALTLAAYTATPARAG